MFVLLQYSMKRIDENTFHVDSIQLPEIFNDRPPETTKHDYGHALLVAGSYGKMGAAVLAARAALRSGVGLLTVHVPACGVEIMQAAVPEAMVSIDEGNFYLRSVPDNIERYDAIAVGPGVGTADKTRRMLRQLLKAVCSKDKRLHKRGGEARYTPVVLDADALNIVAANKRRFFRNMPHSVILTPHAKEYERLFDNMSTLSASREYKAVIVRKSHNTQTVTPEGKTYVNFTGNAGMATGGSGDVLTGIVLALNAQRFPLDISAMLAVYLHGKSADYAVQKQSQSSLLPSDIIENLRFVTL